MTTNHISFLHAAARVAWLIGVAALAQASAAPVKIPCAVPTRHPDWAGWGHQPLHDARVKAAQAGGAPIVFVGDDLVHAFAYGDACMGGRVQWETYFKAGRYRALNLGCRADRTENVLWRLENGELSGFQAKAVVVEVGTRNLERRGETMIDAFLGIRALVERIRALQPQAKVILHPILPRGAAADAPARRVRDAVNKELHWLADGTDVWWCDFNDQLLTADGRLLREISQDGFLYQAYAYEIWANALLPYLDAALDGRRMPKRLPPRVDPALFGNGSLAVEAQSIIGHSYTWEGKKGWWIDLLAKHREQVAQSGGKIDVVFLGDSISNNWQARGSRDFCGIGREFSVMNLGYSGDRTQHVLWRIRNGELDGYKAGVVILMIGTNNQAHEDGLPENVAAGVKAILDTIRAKQPQAKIILHPIFPRCAKAQDQCRVHNEKINALIRPFADGRDVIWCDFNARLLEKDGTLTREMMPDLLHPGAAGYRIWSEEVLPIIRRLLKGQPGDALMKK